MNAQHLEEIVILRRNLACRCQYTHEKQDGAKQPRTSAARTDGDCETDPIHYAFSQAPSFTDGTLTRYTGKTISGLTYKDAGVDISAGERLVEAIRPLARTTRRNGVVDELGGFGALFDLRAAGFVDPLLVASTDGVGTKLKLAIACNRHDTVGIDLVAMCVNDLVVQGAQPLFFLDYYASARLFVEQASAVISGITTGCREAGCALIGGETAEMPGLYAEGDYDLAGFAVGAVERDRVLTGRSIAGGDVVLGLASNGLHSNGFSLVRKMIALCGLDLPAPAPFDETRSLGDALLTPTRIYVASCLSANAAGGLKGLAHITGGGLLENIPRILPKGVMCIVDAAAWPLPAVFTWLARTGGLATEELARTFNCGIGMVAVVMPERAASLRAVFEAAGEQVFEIGRIVAGGSNDPAVLLENAERAWQS